MSSIEPENISGVTVRKDNASKKSSSASLLGRFGHWLTREDSYSDIIISSRIRLARNLKGYAFPIKASEDELEQILYKAKAACKKCGCLNESLFFDISKLSELDRKYLVERRLASPQFIDNDHPSILVSDPQERVTVMVNEEDHLRMQSLEAGLGINDAWKVLSTLDDQLEENLEYSYSSKFGYLTACPTNIGTGLRVSFFAHLPGLSLSDGITQLIEQLPTSEIAVRGFYGEGTQSVGDIFQISNQLTLGRTEKNVIERMISVAHKIVDLEREARSRLLREDRMRAEDTVFRAIGILMNARIISSLESMKMFSAVRLGTELGFISNISRLRLNQLMVLIQPAHLQKTYDKRLNSEERDIARADFIKQNLKF